MHKGKGWESIDVCRSPPALQRQCCPCASPLRALLAATGPLPYPLPQPKRWESAEEAALVRLVKKHGRGNWALILKDGVESGEIDKDRKQVRHSWEGFAAAAVAHAADGGWAGITPGQQSCAGLGRVEGLQKRSSQEHILLLLRTCLAG